MKNKRGQNVIEYILLIVAVLTVFIIFLGSDGKYKKAIENSLFDGAVNQVRSLSNQIKF